MRTVIRHALRAVALVTAVLSGGTIAAADADKDDPAFDEAVVFDLGHHFIKGLSRPKGEWGKVLSRQVLRLPCPLRREATQRTPAPRRTSFVFNVTVPLHDMALIGAHPTRVTLVWSVLRGKQEWIDQSVRLDVNHKLNVDRARPATAQRAGRRVWVDLPAQSIRPDEGLTINVSYVANFAKPPPAFTGKLLGDKCPVGEAFRIDAIELEMQP